MLIINRSKRKYLHSQLYEVSIIKNFKNYKFQVDLSKSVGCTLKCFYLREGFVERKPAAESDHTGKFLLSRQSRVKRQRSTLGEKKKTTHKKKHHSHKDTKPNTNRLQLHINTTSAWGQHLINPHLIDLNSPVFIAKPKCVSVFIG